MDDHGGFIKLYRKSLHSPMWKNLSLWRFWEWCLLKAEYQPTTTLVGYREVALQPGQFIFGRRMAHKETGLSEQTIKTCVRALSEGEKPAITIQTTHAFSVITIVKWEDYQNQKTEGNPRVTHQITSDQPTGNPRPTTINKKLQEEKEIYTSAVDDFEQSYSPLYREVLTVFQEATGRRSRDAATKEGARILAQAIEAGDMDREHLLHVIKAGMNDPDLKNQTLRGVARNFGNYLPESGPERSQNTPQFGMRIRDIMAQANGGVYAG